jgi:protein TonB
MATGPTGGRWDDYVRRWDRTLRRALLASVLFHALVVLLFRQSVVVPYVPQSAAGPDNRADRAAAGGGLEVVAYRLFQPPPVPEEAVIPIPVPVPVALPQPEPEQPPAPPAPVVPAGDAAAPGTGRGPATGPGTEAGAGAGGGGSGEAGGARVLAPTPRGLILPPTDRPGRVRGNTVTVYVFVDERGRVVPDSTRLAPGSGDRAFDSRLIRQAGEWVFNPARRNGQPVAEWFQYVIVL